MKIGINKQILEKSAHDPYHRNIFEIINELKAHNIEVIEYETTSREDVSNLTAGRIFETEKELRDFYSEAVQKNYQLVEPPKSFRFWKSFCFVIISLFIILSVVFWPIILYEGLIIVPAVLIPVIFIMFRLRSKQKKENYIKK